jgi:hypothetical protein
MFIDCQTIKILQNYGSFPACARRREDAYRSVSAALDFISTEISATDLMS